MWEFFVLRIIVLLIIALPVLISAFIIIKIIRDNKESNCNNCPYHDNKPYY